MQDNEINKPSKGLHLDTSPQEQPKDTQRFALNVINETNEGDNTSKSNANSNELKWGLPDNFIPIGKEYLSNNRQVILSISPEQDLVEIGVVNSENFYKRVGPLLQNSLNKTETSKFQFRISHQIDITYRLRQGCRDTIYFTDGFQRPMFLDLSSPEDFYKEGTEEFSPNKFFLQKTPSREPVFNSIEVNDSGGQLKAGSYNFAVQLLDEDFNPTEWLAVTKPINIYHKEQSSEFISIEGTINMPEVDYLNFGETSKSITLDLVPSSLDESFPFYRIAIIEANNGSGQVSAVRYTDRIARRNTTFTYTGTNFLEAGTIEEISTFTSIISSAKHIEQVKNILTLHNTTGSQINFCNLQKYASKIQADAVSKSVVLNSMQSSNNAKNPSIQNELGYMPGEIYSFGIVWKFENGETSPVFHIPGKSETVDQSTIFSRTGENTLPMAKNNSLQNTRYTDNSSCKDFWGVDSEGRSLINQPVRHHRFPSRRQINLPFVIKEDNVDEDGNVVEGTGTFYRYDINSISQSPITSFPGQAFVLRLTYSIEGVQEVSDIIIEADDLVNFTENVDPTTGELIDTTGDLNVLNSTTNIFSNDFNGISLISIEEEQEDGTFITITNGQPGPRGIVHNITEPIVSTFTSKEEIVKTNILGIQFSNVEFPSLEDTNGVKVIGYYIVRQERNEENKTILDSAAILPMVNNGEYTATGLLTPDVQNSKISKNTFAFINPEYKFRKKQYKAVTSIEEQGTFIVEKENKSAIMYQDVQDGTSFDSSRHKGNSGTDADGWSLWVILRDSIVSFRNSLMGFDKSDAEIKEILYFEGLESLSLREEGLDKTLYNTAPDNNIGILRLEENTEVGYRQIPYVHFKRDLAEPYSTFRSDPYYAVENSLQTNETNVLFGGDNYVSPMRYLNTMFYENQIANRKGKSSFGRKLLGALAVISGALLILTGVGAGAGAALIGGGIALFASGVSIDKANETYSDEIYRSLRRTLVDDWVTQEFINYKPGWNAGAVEGNGGNTESGPADDTIKWMTDCVTDLWFDTQINTMLRYTYTSDIPTHLNSPGKDETGNQSAYGGWGYFGRNFLSQQTRGTVSTLERHIRKKLLISDFEREGNVKYLGLPFSEQYLLNEDYQRINKEKFYFHLPIEYDCCSECQEEFKNRSHYSLQSFQEELTDNYRVFLPNNYRDLEGEKGEITDAFRFNDNLYIHTSEGLWILPKNYQERVTDEIVSFIGTGDFFSIPPKLIVDDQLNSGGTKHKWATIKTPYGVFFVSDAQRKVFLFNGQGLKPISDYGLTHWFRGNNLKILEQHLKNNKEDYPFDNNPSNNVGVGYISTYDTSKKRFILTKQDKLYNQQILKDITDFRIITKDNRPFIFRNFSELLLQKEAEGFSYVGIEDCKLKFIKENLVDVSRSRTDLQKFPNTADVIAYLDVSGSFDSNARTQIVNTVKAWETNFRGLNPDWTGSLLFIGDPAGGPQPIGGGQLGGGERWMLSLTETIDKHYSNLTPQELLEKDLVVITFSNESAPDYYGTNSSANFNNFVQGATSTLSSDINSFISSYNRIKSFSGISYPIHFGNVSQSALIQQQLGLLKGRNWTNAEFDQIPSNPFINSWESTMRSSLVVNPIPSNISSIALENYGWQIITQRTNEGTIISEQNFQEDINQLLLGKVVLENFTTVIQEIQTEISFVEGEFIDQIFEADNSYTLSYDLKREEWISWHSYLPNFYYNLSEKFYSWKNGINGMWQHNILAKFGEYYGTKYPFIIEPVVSSLATKIVDSLKFYTEAKRYAPDQQEYVYERFITFNKLIAYNSRQCTGTLNLLVKDVKIEEQNYLSQQLSGDSIDTIILDRNEKEWSLNDLRDIRINYDVPIFNSNVKDFQDEYYMDKVLNEISLDFNKPWQNLESFRDKYLAIRLIFDNFEDVKLLLNFSIKTENLSNR